MRSLGNEIPSYTVSVVWERQEPLLFIKYLTQVRSDGVDETGDANRTLVWVTHRTTGRDGHMTIGSIRTHSLNGQNSRLAANVEREVGQPSIGWIPEETVAHRDSRWDIPRKRALFTSDGPDCTTSGSDIPESHAYRPPEVGY